MHRPMFRLAAAALLLLPLAACGGGKEPTAPPAPAQTASIALGAATTSITAGGTASVTITVTRSNGFAGAVTVTPTGLPTGVTAAPLTIAAGATSGTLSLTAAANAPATTAAAVSITATGTGVTISAQPLALTVVGGNGAAIALSAAAGSIEAGRAGSIIVTVTRSGTFTGTVSVSVSGLPEGVTAVNQTLAAGVTTDTIPLTATLAIAGATTTLSVTGTGSGITIAPQTYALTTVLGPIRQSAADLTRAEGSFANRIAVSANGARMAVASPEAGNGTVRVFDRSGSTWTQVGADILGEAAADRAGSGLAMNAAGTRLAIGAYRNDGGGSVSGHLRIFDLVNGAWTQIGADINGGGTNWGLGWRVALNASGSRVVVSGSERNVQVFDLVSGAWTQVGNTLDIANISFGESVDISDDGLTIAVGAPAGTSGRIGTAYVYRLVGSTWTQLGNTLAGEQDGVALGSDGFGTWLALSADGSRIAVSAPADKEGGISGGGGGAGKIRVFDLNGSTWTQVGNDILGRVGLNGENLGEVLGMSSDGSRIAAVGPSQTIARVWTLTAGAWVQIGPDIGSYNGAARSGEIAFSSDGRTAIVGYTNSNIVRTFSITP